MASSNYPLLPDDNQEYPEIPGLIGMADFIIEERETRIVNYLDRRPWSSITPSSNSRNVQQFGYKYDYSSRSLQYTPTDPLEEDILYLGLHLQKDDWLSRPSNPNVSNLQCIVNEYYRNQGISPHIDREQFGPNVISVSLLEDTVMTFSNGSISYDVYLPRRGILVMTGDARYKWKHSISSRVTYSRPDGTRVKKDNNYRRISLTYRTVPI